MNREFENGNEQEPPRSRGRSRRKGMEGTPRVAADPPRTERPARQGDTPRTERPARQGDTSRTERPVRTGRPARAEASPQPEKGTESEILSDGASGSRVRREAASAEGKTEGRQIRTNQGRGRVGRQEDQAKRKAQVLRRRIIALIVAECIALCGIFVCWNFARKWNLIRRDNSFSMKDMTNPNLDFDKIESMQGYWTVALFGVDSRDNSLGKGNNADVIIICNVNQDTGEIKLVSVFRDTYLNIDDNGSYQKINQSYFRGGPEQAIQALNKNLDLQIDDYATFNWKAAVDAINILGGVDIELSKAEFYYINAYITETVKGTGVGSVQLTHAGMNHLDGVQAVAYARLRKMDTDFARTERQREIISQCFEKMKNADFAVVNNVMEVVLAQIMTGVTLDDLIPAARNMNKYYISETTGFPVARSDANLGKKGDCVIPQTLTSNVTLLHEFLFGEENYEPSEMVKQISAKIASDSGMYNEGKPVYHVDTDGGYIPSPTTAAAGDEEDENLTESSTGETDESIIDGEFPDGLELETDEDGNILDPPEESELHYPGWEPGDELDEDEDDDRPSGIVRPGATTSASEESRTGSTFADGPTRLTSEDESNGPGVSNTTPTTSAAARTPGQTTESSSAASPLSTTAASHSGSVIIGTVGSQP